MSISSIGPSNSYNPPKMVSKMATKMVKELDTNNDGSIDKTEFTTGLKIKGVSQADAEKLFGTIDTSGKGKINQAEIETAMKKNGPKGAPPSGGGRGGPPPGKAPKSGGAEGGSQSSSTKVYDKKDTNKDGTVTYQEEIEYVLSHPEEKLKNQAAAPEKQVNSKYDQRAVLINQASELQGSLDISA